MGNVRVYELAKQLGIENKDLLGRIGELGIMATNHMTLLSPTEVGKIKDSLVKEPVGEVIEKRIHSTVIRRRARRIPVDASPESAKSEAEASDVTTESSTPADAVGDVQSIEQVDGEALVQADSATETDASTESTASSQSVTNAPPASGEGASTTAPEKTAGAAGTPAATSGIKPAMLISKPIKPLPTEAEKRRERGKKVVYDRRRDSGQRRGVKDADDLSGRGGRGKRKKGKRPRPEKTLLTTPKAAKRVVKFDESISVGELARQLGTKFSELAGKLMQMDMMVTINQRLDFETCELVVGDFGFTVENVGFELDNFIKTAESKEENKAVRSPVITIMGHVDHGKTSLLDKIRDTQVAEGEHGGITQHIGAYKVRTSRGEIVFLDTPGHEAFTQMRARGAKVTDMVVLVVAADDGVMPQTVEAINHARDANVPIVVAINKIDRAGANTDRVRQELTEHKLISEDWGGDTIFALVSAKTGEGIDHLLEMLALQSEILELTADDTLPAEGIVIESRLDRGRGPIATVLVQNGTLKQGDYIVAGNHYGRIRAMFNERGERLQKAGPSTPVEVWGFNGVPAAGEWINVAENERNAKLVQTYRDRKVREAEMIHPGKVSLEQLMAQVQAGALKELKLIVKADVQGSIEALVDAFAKIKHDQIEVKTIHKGVGGITESDINLASASNAIVIGFSVRPEPNAKLLAERDGVEIKIYNVIYDAIDELKKAMEGLLDPLYEERTLGRAEVLQTFTVPKIGVIAGCSVKSGKILRSSKARLIRDSVQVYVGSISSLRRFKDDVKEVKDGYECGIGLTNYNDIKPGDFIEAFTVDSIKQTID